MFRTERGAGSRDGAGGFTLLEVLVAFVIAALALGLLFSGVAGGYRAARAAARYQEAISRARSRLAALQVLPITAGVQSGDDGGGYKWSTAERVAATAAMPPGVGNGTPALYALSVTVSWSMDGKPHSLTLNGARLATLAAAP